MSSKSQRQCIHRKVQSSTRGERLTQREGIDYEEIFSPVVRFDSIRLILLIVAHLDLELYQMDIKTAFLNRELDEEIYMDQPVCFIANEEERKICKLR